MRIIPYILIFIIGCKPVIKEQVLEYSKEDSIIVSSGLYDSASVVIPKAEKAIRVVQRDIKNYIIQSDKMVDSLCKENEALKQTILITKSIVVHDTIYIKEKTNFWGRKKVSIDSSSSVTEDSTIIEKDHNEKY